MQVLAHLTELMKFDTRPTGSSTTSKPQDVSLVTTTTIRPTAPHRPGIYAPSKPPGAEVYFANQKCKIIKFHFIASDYLQIIFYILY